MFVLHQLDTFILQIINILVYTKTLTYHIIIDRFLQLFYVDKVKAKMYIDKGNKRNVIYNHTYDILIISYTASCRNNSRCVYLLITKQQEILYMLYYSKDITVMVTLVVDNQSTLHMECYQNSFR